MVIVGKGDNPPRGTEIPNALAFANPAHHPLFPSYAAVRKFEGQVLVLYHNTTIQPRYQAMLHCGSVRQTVKIVSIDHSNQALRTGDRASVIFEFVASPEYVKVR